MVPGILHNFTCWVDNKGKLGVCDTVKLPKLEYLKEDHIGGGMTGKQEMRFMAHEVLKAEAHFVDIDRNILSLFGLGPHEETAIQFRGSITRQGQSGFEPAIVYMRGFVEIEPEEWKVAAKTGLTMPISVAYLHVMVGDQSVLKLEPLTATWEVNGREVMPGMKQAMGY